MQSRLVHQDHEYQQTHIHVLPMWYQTHSSQGYSRNYTVTQTCKTTEICIYVPLDPFEDDLFRWPDATTHWNVYKVKTKIPFFVFFNFCLGELLLSDDPPTCFLFTCLGWDIQGGHRRAFFHRGQQIRSIWWGCTVAWTPRTIRSKGCQKTSSCFRKYV